MRSAINAFLDSNLNDNIKIVFQSGRLGSAIPASDPITDTGNVTGPEIRIDHTLSSSLTSVNKAGIGYLESYLSVLTMTVTVHTITTNIVVPLAVLKSDAAGVWVMVVTTRREPALLSYLLCVTPPPPAGNCSTQ